jgi:hypothetical protein
LPVLTGGQNNSANTIWSYELAQLILKGLTKDGKPYYQDLQMVFANCHSGGMVDAIKTVGLPGNYSAVSAVPSIGRQQRQLFHAV